MFWVFLFQFSAERNSEDKEGASGRAARAKRACFPLRQVTRRTARAEKRGPLLCVLDEGRSTHERKRVFGSEKE